MFWSSEILQRRKGGFATVWIAATLGAQGASKKLSKREILAADLVKASERIIEPEEPMALRLSASLMFGVVRLYQKQQLIFMADVEHVSRLINKAHAELFKAAAAGSLDMTAQRAKSDAITLAQPHTDEAMYLAGDDDYAWQLAETHSRGASATPMLEQDDEEARDVASLLRPRAKIEDADDDYGAGRQSKRSKTGSARPAARNTIADDNAINLVEDALEPLARRDDDADNLLGGELGDFDLFPMAAGGPSESGAGWDGLDFGVADFGQPDYETQAAAHQDDAPREQAYRALGGLGSVMGVGDEDDRAPVSPTGSAKRARSEETPPPAAKKARKASTKRTVVDNLVEIDDEQLQANRRDYSEMLKRENEANAERVYAAEASRRGYAAVFGVPADFLAPELIELYQTNVKFPELGRARDAKQAGPAKAPSVPREIEDEVGRSRGRDTDFAGLDNGGGGNDGWDDLDFGVPGGASSAGGPAFGFEPAVELGRARTVSQAGSDVEIGRRASAIGSKGASPVPSLDAPWNVGDGAGGFDFGPPGPGSRRSASSVVGAEIEPAVELGTRRRSRQSTANAGSQRGHRSSSRAPSGSPPRHGSDLGFDELGKGAEDEPPAADFSFDAGQISTASLQPEVFRFFEYTKRHADASARRKIDLLFSDLCPTAATATGVAAAAFHHILTLASRGLIGIEQTEPYGEIALTVAESDL